MTCFSVHLRFIEYLCILKALAVYYSSLVHQWFKTSIQKTNNRSYFIYLNDYLLWSVYFSFTISYKEIFPIFDRSMFTEPGGLSWTVCRSNKLGNTINSNKGAIMCEMMLLFLHASTMIIERKGFVFHFTS